MQAFGSVGGFSYNEDGSTTGETIFFIQDPPFNNFWLMVIFIWIQTGFAMVILSAAIKAVPADPEAYIPSSVPSGQHVAGFVLLPYGISDFVGDDPYNFGWKLIRANPAMTPTRSFQ